ncbi:hypothetical protein ABXS75_10880 [Roseburia hominis]
MIYVCCKEGQRIQEEERVAARFQLKEIVDHLEDANEVIVIGVPDVRMQDEINRAKRYGCRVRYEDQKYLQEMIMYHLLASKAELEELEPENDMDLDRYLGIMELE